MLSMWTVYDNPTDYPGKFVARRFDVDADGARPTASIIVAPDLNTLRDILCYELRLTPISRNDKDDAKIVETWL